MAQITINIGNADISRVVNGVCGFFGYEPFLLDANGLPTIPNPETQNQFAKRMTAQSIKGWVKSFESQAAAEAARLAANQSGDQLDIT